LKEHAKELKVIKNDRFLRKAMIDGEEFFEVSVQQISQGLSDINKRTPHVTEGSSKSVASKKTSSLATVTQGKGLNVMLID